MNESRLGMEEVNKTSSNFSYEYQFAWWSNQGFPAEAAQKFAVFMSEVYGQPFTSFEEQRLWSAVQQYAYALDGEWMGRFNDRIEMALAIASGNADDLLI